MSKRIGTCAVTAVSTVLLVLLAVPAMLLVTLMGFVWDSADKLTQRLN